MLKDKFFASADLAKELYWPDSHPDMAARKQGGKSNWPDFIPTEIALKLQLENQ